MYIAEIVLWGFSVFNIWALPLCQHIRHQFASLSFDVCFLHYVFFTVYAVYNVVCQWYFPSVTIKWSNITCFQFDFKYFSVNKIQYQLDSIQVLLLLFIFILFITTIKISSFYKYDFLHDKMMSILYHFFHHLSWKTFK